MEPPPPTAKDPGAGFVLALVFPGLGHLYAGRGAAFAVFLAIELFLFQADEHLLLGMVHLFQAIAAAGAVKNWNRAHIPATDVSIPPPPPATRRAAAPRAAPPPPAPPAAPEPPPPTTPLDAEGFLEEIQAAWTQHRSGGEGARHFADRKWRAIRRVKVTERDEADALVAAANELAAGGVLTSEEVAMLARQAGVR